MSEVFIIIALTIISGLFSMAEIALISARKARLETQAAKGDAKALQALQLANHPDTFLSTVQIGITLIGIFMGMYSGETITTKLTVWLQKFSAIAVYAKPIATTTVVVCVTYLSLVVGELLPKRIGYNHPETIAKTAAGPMRWLSRLTFPFIWLLTKSTQLLAQLFGITNNDSQVTEEEIKAIISEGTEQGTIDEAEQEIIERVFHLGDRNITSLMTHRSDIMWIDLNKTVAQAKQQIAGETIHSIYPVCDGEIDEIKGYVSIKNILLEKQETLISSLVNKAMYVPENNTAYQVLEQFKNTKSHQAFIVDEYGSVQGLITLNDILDAIVGDVPQADEDDYTIVKRDDGSFLVDGQIPFYNVLNYFDKTEWANEGEQEFDTLAGFILHELEIIPKTGDTFNWKNFTFEIIDMDNHRIDKVLITEQQP